MLAHGTSGSRRWVGQGANPPRSPVRRSRSWVAALTSAGLPCGINVWVPRPPSKARSRPNSRTSAAGLLHSYGPTRPGVWNEVWLAFAGPVFAALERDGILDRRHPVWRPGLAPEPLGRLLGIGERADRIGGTPDPGLVAELHHLLLDLHARAARFGVSYDRLRRAFQASLGTSPGRWRDRRRIERGKDLLLQGCTLDATADRLGYCDRFFLARQFRRHVGVPPGRWRRDMGV